MCFNVGGEPSIFWGDTWCKKFALELAIAKISLEVQGLSKKHKNLVKADFILTVNKSGIIL